jgi:hypothetical protein
MLLLILFVGFAKTFFLRSLFEVPQMPSYLYLHGFVLTAWYLLAFAQVCLVAAHRTDLHRRLGPATVGAACLVVPVSAYVLFRYPPRGFGRGRTLDFVRDLMVGDGLSLLLFVVFVAAGVYFRRQPDVHKRLMIASSFMIYGPVFARLDIYYSLPIPDPVVTFLPLVVLGIYDFSLLRREHRTTMWIALVMFVTWGFVRRLLLSSGAPDALINALR